MQNYLFNEASRLAALGYRVFPCVPGEKRPLTTNGCNDATTDEETIESWWTLHPNANVAVSTDGLIVVDTDPLEDGQPNSWLDDVESQAELLAGAGTITPRQGTHYWFRQPESGSWRNTASKLATRVDTRATGGYVLVPCSKTEAGQYHWQPGFRLDVRPDELPEPPKWLLERLSADEPKVKKSATVNGTPAEEVIPAGERNSTLTSLGGYLRRGGLKEPEIRAALLAANISRCNPPLDDAEVAKIAWSVCRYDPDQTATADAEGWPQPDLSGLPKRIEDPGPLNPNLLHVPGLIGDYIAWCNETAFVPQPTLALAAALAMMGSITGRKITDETGTRTNIYCVGVCESGGGKDHARKCTKEALSASGLSHLIGPEGIASSAGLVSAVEHQPCVLCQIDEFGRCLMTLKNPATSPHLYKVITELMKLFTSSSTIYVGDAYADVKQVKRIDQPNLCVYGTTVPESLFASLTQESLSDGLVGRLLVFEAPAGGVARDKVTPARCPGELVEQIDWWGKYCPGGNLSGTTVQPRVLQSSEGALEIFRDLANLCEQKKTGETEGCRLWVRAVEKARKLALLCQASCNRLSAEIEPFAAEWACSVVRHLTERMAYLADRHVSSGRLDENCKRILRVIEASGEDGISQTALLRKTRAGMGKRERDDALSELIRSGEITIDQEATGGRKRNNYRIVDPNKCAQKEDTQG